MGASVGFNYQSFRTRYPEFNNTVTGDVAAELFIEAGLYHRNDGTGPVKSSLSQSLFMNMVVAHLAMLYFGTDADPPTSLVGRLNSASEGSVSIGIEASSTGGPSQDWWWQTKYGAAYWAASAAYRTMRYLVPRTRSVNPWPFL